MSVTKEEIHELVLSQKKFFRSGRTLDTDFRIRQLKTLRDQLLRHREDLEKALAEDLGRSPMEAYMFDIGVTVMEINEYIRGLRKWQRPELRFSGIMSFPSVFTKVYKMPYGVTFIISPFNFPVLLTIGVLAASIAGGNTAIIKASGKSGACTAAMRTMLAEAFPEKFVSLVDGGYEASDYILEERIDKVFYTGSPAVARGIMEKASKNLVPVALELGGETGNWCIVRKDADIRDAARKIAFIKTANCGQICININQVAVAEEIAGKFIEELKREFVRQIGEDATKNPEYPRLISEKAFSKCSDEADRYRDRIVFGGFGDMESLKYSPTVIYPADIDDDIVMHELFSPLLPVVAYKDKDIDALLDTVAEREHGLALYIFTKSVKWAEKVMSTQQFGGGCINDVCMHILVEGAPFNGTGHSGMGAYHGVYGFREFTHPCTVLFGCSSFSLPIREHPYSGKGSSLKRKIIEMFER